MSDSFVQVAPDGGGKQLDTELIQTAVGSAINTQRVRATGNTQDVLDQLYWTNIQKLANLRAIYANLQQAPGLTQVTVGQALFPITPAETSASLTPTNQGYQVLEVIDVLRYGIVPNNPAAAANNSIALIALGNPQVNGPQGRMVFPNTTGADIYYFSGIAHQMRPGISMDLCGCTLNFSKLYNSGTDDAHGFIEAISNFAIENGTLNVNYAGGGSLNAGAAIRFGSRQGYAWGLFPNGIFDSDNNVFMGQLAVRNLTITTNNAAAQIVLMLGGLDGVVFENVKVDGGLQAITGILYEFGFSSTNGNPGTSSLWSSSHGRNMHFRNVRATNLKTAGATDGGGVYLVGAYNCLLENIHTDTGYCSVQIRSGEALYYRVWSRDTTGVQPAHMTLRNISGQNLVSNGIILKGDELATFGAGYLSTVISALGHPGDYIAQTDLIQFSLDGFSVNTGGNGAGVYLSGPGVILNGKANGCTNGIVVTDECTQFLIDNVSIENSTGIGLRASFGSAIWSAARLKTGVIQNCRISGSAASAGISIFNSEYILIKNNRLGFNTLYDATANESTQTDGISIDATTNGGGVVCIGNFITVSGAGVGYHIIGSATNPCSFWQGKNTTTSTGTWVNGISTDVLFNNAGEISGASGLTYTTNGNVNIAAPASGTTPALAVQSASNSATIAMFQNNDATNGGYVLWRNQAAVAVGYLGTGPDTITGINVNDFGTAAGASQNYVIGRANGAAAAVTVDPNGHVTVALPGSSGAALSIPAGTTTVEPLLYNSGTNLTTAVAGAAEFDGTCKYFSPAASSRAVDVAEYIEVISSAYTLTSQTAAQKLLNATANGAVTLPVGTYEFECCFSLTSLNTGTSSIFGFALGGGATFTQAWWAHAVGAALATASTMQGTFNTAANVAIVAANTSGNGHAIVKGIIRVTVTGTVIPQVSLNTAAAAVVGTNSYFRAWPVGNGTVTNVGNWS